MDYFIFHLQVQLLRVDGKNRKIVFSLLPVPW